jgi:hypothetical protein
MMCRIFQGAEYLFNKGFLSAAKGVKVTLLLLLTLAVLLVRLAVA